LLSDVLSIEYITQIEYHEVQLSCNMPAAQPGARGGV